MSAVVTLVGALSLLWVPSLLDRVGRHLSPRWVVRLGASSIFLGVFVSAVGLALIAAPTVLRSLDLHRLASVCDRLLIHLGVAVPGYLGWLGFVALVTIVALATKGTIQALRADHELRFVLQGDATESFGEFPVMVVKSSLATAFGLGGRSPRIIITTALAERLDQSERDVVLAHEAAHLRYRDPELLRVLRALELASPRWLPLAKAVACVRLAVERAADEAAGGVTPQRRRIAVNAVLKATGIDNPPLPAISSAETIARRVSALLDPAPSHSGFTISAAASLVVVPMAISGAGIVSWVSHGHTALALVGWCPV